MRKYYLVSKCCGFYDLFDGDIVCRGEAPYDMPLSITAEFANRFLTYPPGHKNYIPQLASQLTTKARSRLLAACRSIGGQTWELYRSCAIKWAALTSDDCKWHIEKFFPLVIEDIAAPLIDTVMITDRNIRLVLTPLGWLSFAEFLWRYDQTVVDHLSFFLAERQSQHGVFCERLRHTIKHCTAELCAADVIVADAAGVGRRSCVGLASVASTAWPVPGGGTVLEEVLTDDETEQL